MTGCRECAKLNRARTYAMQDLRDAKFKLAKYGDDETTATRLADVEDRKARVASNQRRIDEHQAECQFIPVEKPTPAPKRQKPTPKAKSPRKVIDRDALREALADLDRQAEALRASRS